MNQYATELPNVLDVSYFQEIANSIITQDWLSTPDPVALGKYTDAVLINVSDYEYLTLLKNKHPNLRDYIKFMKSSKGSWPVHVDNHRTCAINIPIANTESTFTRFYDGGTKVDSVTEEFGGYPGTWYSNEYLTYITEANLVFEHVLSVPTIIDSTVPHGINNNGTESRIICSWAYDGTYANALEDFGV